MLQKSFIELGDYKYRAYVDSDEQGNEIHLPSAGIQTYYLLQTGTILKGQTQRVDLAAADQALKVISVWVDNYSGTNNSIRFTVYRGSEEVFRFDLNSGKVPFEFPMSIFTPDLSIEVRANSADLTDVLVYFQPVVLAGVLTPAAG